jgi:hypothetical protein
MSVDKKGPPLLPQESGGEEQPARDGYWADTEQFTVSQRVLSLICVRKKK